MRSLKRTILAGSIAAAIMILLCASVAVAGSGRQRTFRGTPPLIIGTEYRIPANPDSPWLESIAVASTSSGGAVVWTESGPKERESTVRLARLAADGHPIDAGRPLFENGHFQRHVAIDSLNDQFVVAWCDISGTKNQVVALRLDVAGRPLDSAPLVIADNVGSSEPEVGVTCGNAACLVTWGGDIRQGGGLLVGPVKGVEVHLGGGAQSASVPLQLVEKGFGNGIGTDRINYCMVYAEEQAYGQSGGLVAKLVAGNGSIAELSLPSSQQVEFGTTWVAWNGSQWFILLLDLTTTGGLSQEVRFMRVDSAGKPVGEADAVLFESSTVPPLCPQVPDLFLYDPQNRRVVWDGYNFVVFTQRSIARVTKDGIVGSRLAADDYFPRSYATSVASSGGGRTVVAYSRDNAVAVRVIYDSP